MEDAKEAFEATKEKLEAQTEPEETEETNEKPESEEDIKATDNGWKPDGEFTAAEFNRRGELYGKISDQKKEIRGLRDFSLQNTSDPI